MKPIPPGPSRDKREHILLGSLFPFGKYPLKFFQELVPYGDISMFRLLHLNCYFVNHPDYIRQVMQEHYQLYGKDTIDFAIFRKVLGNGLFTSQGESWKRQRKTMQPMFHRKSVLQFGEVMSQAIEDMVRNWQDQEVLDMWPEMRTLATRIVGRALFGIDPNLPAVEKQFEAIERYIVELFQVPLPLPLWVPIPQNARLLQAQRALYPLLDELIIERRRNPQWDLISMFIQAGSEDSGQAMSNEQIRDEVVTLLFAGHQTTASALNWVWYLLANHPAIEGRLHEEVDSAFSDGHFPTTEDLPSLPYTAMLIKEALRLWPPAFFTNRWVRQDDKFGEYTVKKGSIIFFSMYTMHRHPDFWEDPESFDPERFTPERSAQRPRCAYIPFGVGPHVCIGEHFATMELQLAVAAIASRYQLLVEPGYSIVSEPTPALRPNNLHMRLKKRK